MYVTDTHPLIWYASGDRKLSKKVKDVFDDCLIRGKIAIYLPTVVLWEISLVLKADANEFDLAVPYDEFVDRLFEIKTLIEEPVTAAIVKRSHDLNFHTDPFDTIIVATALERDLPLITNDAVLHREEPCQLFWD